MEVKTMWRSGKGFTLIELMVVIAIILILALIAVPAYRNMQVRAKKARVQEDLRNIATALEAYYVDWNQYPPAGSNGDQWVAELTGGNQSTTDSASINTSSNTTATGETGGIVYIKKIPDDPFAPGTATGSARLYHYALDSSDPSIWYLWSVGPNGTNDTTAPSSTFPAGDDVGRTNS